MRKREAGPKAACRERKECRTVFTASVWESTKVLRYARVTANKNARWSIR